MGRRTAYLGVGAVVKEAGKEGLDPVRASAVDASW
jgi:hypothetical protein